MLRLDMELLMVPGLAGVGTEAWIWGSGLVMLVSGTEGGWIGVLS